LVNYSDHAVEFGHEEPKEPLIFLKPPSAVIATEETIRLPARSRWVEYEAEIAVVIGRRARNVSVAQAENYILGYSLMNDVTARDLQKDDGQWMRAKGFDTFAPLGPWIVTGLNPKKLRVQAWLNGRCRQNETTAKMIFDIPTLVSFISRVMTLEPGDVISTGTPSGVAPLKSGDRIEIRSPEIGRLVNKVL